MTIPGPLPKVEPPVFLTADWRYLAMLNFETSPKTLAPYLPAGTELDEWNGRTYLSVVAFLFLNTRLLGWAVPFHQDFEEVNLRFYVRRRGPEGWRRGVVFIREIVPLHAVSAVARLVYNEQYVTRPMRHHLDLQGGTLAPGGRVAYGWRSGRRWNTVQVTTAGPPLPLVPGSEPEFITEHYWGYVRQRDGSTVEYRVEHEPWRVWNAAAASLTCDVAAVYGPHFAECLTATPLSAFVAEGSPVVVRRGVRVG